MRGRGCASCFDSGYRGRLGIYELLPMDRDFQELVLRNPGLEEMRKHQEKHGMSTLQAEGLRLVLEGKTTLEEITRAVLVE